MSLVGGVRGELIDLIEWADEGPDTLVYRFPRHRSEIKVGAKLLVRETQNAIFVDEGKLGDIFAPGTYTLTNQSLRILSSFRSLRPGSGSGSSFAADAYFVSLRKFVDRKWGTSNPILLRDPQFGPVRLRAYGVYSLRVSSPEIFMKEIVGADPLFRTEGVGDQLRSMIVSRFGELLVESRIPILELALNHDELGRFATDRLHKEFERYGLDLSNLTVENTALPPQVVKAVERRSELGPTGDFSRFMGQSAPAALEAAPPIRPVAAGEGAGLGKALEKAQRIADSLHARDVRSAPPPVPSNVPRYYLAIAGHQAGPFDLSGLRAEIQSGRLSRSTLVWKDGMSSWEPAEKVPEVSPLLPPGGPPPLPSKGSR